jgi:uncharacterized protein (DUF2236 family)
MRSVLMQLTHPAIAAAGLQSAGFRESFLGRAWRTFATMSQVVFGDVETASAGARRIHVLHARTRGVIPAEASPDRAGEPFRGTDPPLLLWVLATMYEGSAFMYERLVAPLGEAERARYWDESRRLGLVLGIPDDEMPPTLADLAEYRSAMEQHELEAGPAARDLAAFIVRSFPGRRPRLAAAWTAGSLAPEWADALGIAGDGLPARDFVRSAAALRRTLGALPSAARRTPPHHHALIRTRSASPFSRGVARLPIPSGLELLPLEGDDPAIHRDLFGG